MDALIACKVNIQLQILWEHIQELYITAQLYILYIYWRYVPLCIYIHVFKLLYIYKFYISIIYILFVLFQCNTIACIYIACSTHTHTHTHIVRTSMQAGVVVYTRYIAFISKKH